MVPWTVASFGDPDNIMGRPLKPQGLGEALPVLRAEAEAEKEDRLVAATWAGSREQIVRNFLRFNPGVFAIRQPHVWLHMVWNGAALPSNNVCMPAVS